MVERNVSFLLFHAGKDAFNNYVTFEQEHVRILEEALKQSKMKVAEQDDTIRNSPKITFNTPSYRHFQLVCIPDNYFNITKLGQLSVEVSKYIRSNEPELYGQFPTLNLGEREEFKNYCELRTKLNCKPSKYRSIDGTCNNLKNPYGLGTAMRPFHRLLPPEYCDGVSSPRCSLNSTLPSARDVSLKLHRADYESDRKFNFMFAVWGQFIDHDLTSTGVTKKSEMVSCCESTNVIDDCFPVMLSEDDPFFILYNTSCMEFIRSSAAPSCTLGSREQLNQVTSYLDGSAIYGSDVTLMKRLRSFTNGRLAVSWSDDGRELLPISKDLTDGCNREEEAKKHRYCFLTGDSRANENLHLTTIHLIMVRHHNNVASQLLKFNPHWRDETLYQETKKIVAAQLQHITYNEFLPPLLGQEVMDEYNLTVEHSGYSFSYDENINPNIANNFASSAFRFAHSLLPGLMRSYEKTAPEAWTQLREILFNPFPLYSSGSLERILMSAAGTKVLKTNRFFTNEVTQHLFEEPQNSTTPKKCGLDLVSLNIQRGRDHGLPGYIKWREYCSLSSVRNFDDLNEFMDQASVDAIKTLYTSVDDIDLYSGSLSEKPLKNSILGPTALCLIADQFRRIKLGDRFWHENGGSHTSFTKDQLDVIKSTTLSKIVCENVDLSLEVPRELLQFSNPNNENVDCGNFDRINYKPWNDA